MPIKKKSKYFFLLKKSTELNKKLPVDKRLTYSERRKLIKDYILPDYIDIPIYKIGIKELNKKIISNIAKFPARENCNPNYIRPDDLIVNYFDIDNFLGEVLSKCLYVRVNAGIYGVTKIFILEKYKYEQTGVKNIVEAIRENLDDTLSSLDAPIFVGYVKRKPNKRNDGSPQNYFIDMILVINDKHIADNTENRFDILKEKKAKSKIRSVSSAINEKIKKLKSKKQKQKRAKKTFDNKIAMLKIINNKISKRKRVDPRLQLIKLQTYKSLLKILLNQYDKGLINKEQFNKRADELQKIFSQ